MKFPMLSISVLLVFTLFICTLFINDKDTSPKIVLDGDFFDTGRVLGVSEAMPIPGAESLYLGLYDRAGIDPLDKRPPAPQKTGTEADFMLPAGRGAVLDSLSGAVLYGQAAEEKAPIASLTKLATALVFLEYNRGWEEIYELRPEDRIEGGMIYLMSGEKVKIKDLFYLSLVASDNTATQALVNAAGAGQGEFIARMNAKMKELGLKNTRFADPIGLSGENVSTALEVAGLAKAALASPEISEATLTKRYEFSTVQGRRVAVDSTDVLLEVLPQNGIRILGGKTGYIDSAGYCFAGKFVNEAGRELIAVVLGSDSPNLRFRWAKNMAEWTYRNYEWLK
ncbi:MAG: serine hydrolase [Candidatus Falkowbacteria bacterium]